MPRAGLGLQGPLASVPRTIRPLAWRGFCLLGIVIASHAVLETARDALFLADLPAERLPYAYLAIAAGAIGVGFVHRALGGFNARRGALVATLALGSATTLALWAGLAIVEGWRSPFVLYVWAGLLATIVVVQFWLRMGELLDVQTAKPVFAFVASGGLAGAAAGSFAARVFVEFSPPEGLVALAALFLAIASAAALRFGAGSGEGATQRGGGSPDRDDPAAGSDASLAALFRASRGDVYLRRVLILSLAAPVALTTVDFIFKDAVSREIPAKELPEFFATFYTSVNVFAILFQLFVVPRLLTRFGAIASLALLPALLAAGAGGAAILGSLLPIVALKGIDGAMHHSLHRASSEILYLPIEGRLRDSAKFLSASLGHRGGQAIGSLLILGLLAAGIEAVQLATLTLGLSLLWWMACMGLRQHYIANFRSRIGHLGAEALREIPRLELDSLETLFRALSSPRDDEVMAALELLEAYDRHPLVPGLILYHPTPRVVIRAVELLDGQDRGDLAPLMRRRLSDPSAEVRAAILRCDTLEISDDALRDIMRTDSSPVVRAAAIARIARLREHDRSLARIRRLLGDGEAETEIAVARSLPDLAPELACAVARDLLESDDLRVRDAVAHGLAEEPTPEALPLLVDLLDCREARLNLRDALVKLGDEALALLVERLDDPQTRPAIRRHLPRSISSFGNQAAARVLVERLVPGIDPDVRYKILRGVGRIRADAPSTPVEEKPLLDEALRSLRRAVEMLAGRVLWAWVQDVEADSPAARDLLGRLLEEKEQRALERVFRILHILSPGERFEAIWNGILEGDRRDRAGSIELFLDAVDGSIRDGVAAMFGAGEDDERLRNVAAIDSVPLAERAIALLDAASADPAPLSQLLPAARATLADAFRQDHDPILVAVADEAGLLRGDQR